MTTLDIVLVFLLIILAFAIYYLLSKKKTYAKPSYVKKDEIIEDYKNQMKRIIEENKDNPSLKKAQQINLLKQINQELSMNLFFSEEEAKKLINQLAQM